VWKMPSTALETNRYVKEVTRYLLNSGESSKSGLLKKSQKERCASLSGSFHLCDNKKWIVKKCVAIR
jgi:hypothetical protein